MERLSGHELLAPEQEDLEEEQKLKLLALARKVHLQLTDIILQLASLKFDKIGSLREDPEGGFYIVPYVDLMATGSLKHKAVVYKGLESSSKDSFLSSSDWYKAIAHLNRKCALEDPEEAEEDRVATVGDYEILAKCH